MLEIRQACPLLCIASEADFVRCLGERCAWYDVVNGQCAVQSLADGK